MEFRLPEAPEKYNAEDQAQLRRAIEQFARQVIVGQGIAGALSKYLDQGSIVGSLLSESGSTVTSGANLGFSPDNTLDIGAGSLRPRDVIAGRDVLAGSSVYIGTGDGRIVANAVNVLSASDVVLFSGVAAGLVLLRNTSIGGTALFLLDSSFPTGGVLVASNGGAIWVANAVPAAAEVRVSMSGTDVIVRAGATRNNNDLRAVLIRARAG